MTDKRICGAKNRNGRVCHNKPMKNGRCYKHGGKSTGAPKGNQNARKHGAYASFFTEEEKAQLDDISLIDVKSELMLCKIQLIRALEAQEKQLQPNEKTDFGTIIDRLIGRIQSLTHSMQDMQSKSIDIELKQIELNKIKSAELENQVLPVKVVIQVEDARNYDKSQAECASGEVSTNVK